MLNQFAIPTLLILLVILVWFAVVWWRARRDDKVISVRITVYAVDDADDDDG